MVIRLSRFGLPVSDASAAYREAVLAHPAVRQWVRGALREPHFLPAAQPYRDSC